MTSPADYFWEQAEALASGLVATRRDPDGTIELFIPTTDATLEITGRGKLVSVAWKGLFIEDRAIEVQENADLLLAVCDSILAQRASMRSDGATASLTTRGYATVWRSA